MSKVSEPTIARVAKLLEDWPADKPRPCFAEVAAALGVAEVTASTCIQKLHMRGLVHRKWRITEQGNRAAQIWFFGPGEDEPKPVAMTPREQKHHWRERNKAERKRMEELRRPVEPFRHWQDVAFFGAP